MRARGNGKIRPSRLTSPRTHGIRGVHTTIEKGSNTVYTRARMIGGILTAAGLMLAGSAQAMNFGDMMNPSKWMGGNKDRYDDYGYRGYGYPGYGYGGYPGYGYGGYPGYGYGGYPGYGYPGGYGGGYQSSSPIIITPQSGGSNQAPPPQVR